MPNTPPQATRWSSHLVINRHAQRAPERERFHPMLAMQSSSGQTTIERTRSNV